MFRELSALAGQIVQLFEQSGFAADQGQFESVVLQRSWGAGHKAPSACEEFAKIFHQLLEERNSMPDLAGMFGGLLVRLSWFL